MLWLVAVVVASWPPEAVLCLRWLAGAVVWCVAVRKEFYNGTRNTMLLPSAVGPFSAFSFDGRQGPKVLCRIRASVPAASQSTCIFPSFLSPFSHHPITLLNSSSNTIFSINTAVIAGCSLFIGSLSCNAHQRTKIAGKISRAHHSRHTT